MCLVCPCLQWLTMPRKVPRHAWKPEGGTFGCLCMLNTASSAPALVNKAPCLACAVLPLSLPVSSPSEHSLNAVRPTAQPGCCWLTGAARSCAVMLQDLLSNEQACRLPPDDADKDLAALLLSLNPCMCMHTLSAALQCSRVGGRYRLPQAPAARHNEVERPIPCVGRGAVLRPQPQCCVGHDQHPAVPGQAHLQHVL